MAPILAQLVAQQTCHLKVPWFKSRLQRSSFSMVCNFPSSMVEQRPSQARVKAGNASKLAGLLQIASK